MRDAAVSRNSFAESDDDEEEEAKEEHCPLFASFPEHDGSFPFLLAAAPMTSKSANESSAHHRRIIVRLMMAAVCFAFT